MAPDLNLLANFPMGLCFSAVRELFRWQKRLTYGLLEALLEAKATLVIA